MASDVRRETLESAALVLEKRAEFWQDTIKPSDAVRFDAWNEAARTVRALLEPGYRSCPTCGSPEEIHEPRPGVCTSPPERHAFVCDFLGGESDSCGRGCICKVCDIKRSEHDLTKEGVGAQVPTALCETCGQGVPLKDLGSPEVEIGNPAGASPGSALGHGGQSAQMRKVEAHESSTTKAGVGAQVAVPGSNAAKANIAPTPTEVVCDEKATGARHCSHADSGRPCPTPTEVAPDDGDWGNEDAIVAETCRPGLRGIDRSVSPVGASEMLRRASPIEVAPEPRPDDRCGSSGCYKSRREHPYMAGADDRWHHFVEPGSPR